MRRFIYTAVLSMSFLVSLSLSTEAGWEQDDIFSCAWNIRA